MRQPLFFFSRRNKSAKIWRISVTQSQSREKSRENLAHPTRYRPGSRTLARHLNSNLDNADADVQTKRPLRRPGPPRNGSPPGICAKAERNPRRGASFLQAMCGSDSKNHLRPTNAAALIAISPHIPPKRTNETPNKPRRTKQEKTPPIKTRINATSDDVYSS